MTMLKLLLKKRNPKQLQESNCEVQYCAVINDRFTWFNTQQEMLEFVEKFGKENIIHKITLFKHQIYQLNEH